MSDRQQKRQLGGELVIPVLAVAFTLYFFTTIWNSPWTAQVSAFLVGGVLLLVCAIFMVRCVIWISRGEGSLGFGNLFRRDDLSTGRIWFFLATIGFCVLVDYLGFTLTTFLFIFVSTTILAKGQHIPFNAFVAAVIALAGWAVFIWAFDTRFPEGYFELAMEALLSDG